MVLGVNIGGGEGGIIGNLRCTEVCTPSPANALKYFGLFVLMGIGILGISGNALIISFKVENKYREGSEGDNVRPYNSTKRANNYIRSYMKHHS